MATTLTEGDAEREWGKVHDAEDPAGHHLIGDALGDFGRDAQDRETHVAGGDDVRHRVDRLDHQAVVGAADLLGVVVEEGDDVETTAAKAAIAEQSRGRGYRVPPGPGVSRGRSRGSAGGRGSALRSDNRSPDNRTDRRKPGLCGPVHYGSPARHRAGCWKSSFALAAERFRAGGDRG